MLHNEKCVFICILNWDRKASCMVWWTTILLVTQISVILIILWELNQQTKKNIWLFKFKRWKISGKIYPKIFKFLKRLLTLVIDKKGKIKNACNHSFHRIFYPLGNIDVHQHIGKQIRHWLYNSHCWRLKSCDNLKSACKEVTAIFFVRTIGTITDVITSLIFSNARHRVPLVTRFCNQIQIL